MTVVSRVESAGTTSTGLFQWLREGTPTARRGLLAASLGWMLDGFDIMLYALVIGALLRDFSISTATAGFLGSLTLVASGIGGVLFGAIADRFGRRRTMIGSILVYSIFTAACGLAQTVWQLGIRLARRLPHRHPAGAADTLDQARCARVRCLASFPDGPA